MYELPVCFVLLANIMSNGEEVDAVLSEIIADLCEDISDAKEVTSYDFIAFQLARFPELYILKFLLWKSHENSTLFNNNSITRGYSNSIMMLIFYDMISIISKLSNKKPIHGTKKNASHADGPFPSVSRIQFCMVLN